MQHNDLQVVVGKGIARIVQHKPRRAHNHVGRQLGGSVVGEKGRQGLVGVFGDGGISCAVDARCGGGARQSDGGVRVVGHFWELGHKRRVQARGTPGCVEARVECAFGHIDQQGLFRVAKHRAERVVAVHHVHEEAVAGQARVGGCGSFHAQRVPRGRGSVAVAEHTRPVVEVGLVVVVARSRVRAAWNVHHGKGSLAVEAVGDANLVVSVAQGEHLVVQHPRNAAGGGDLHDQPTSIDGQRVGGRVQHVPRAAGQGVDFEARAAGKEVVRDAWIKGGVFHNGGVGRPRCRQGRRPRQSNGGVAVVGQIGKRGKKRRIDARGIPAGVERAVVDVGRGLDDDVLFVGPVDRRKLVGGVLSVDVKAVDGASVTHGWGGFHSQSVLRSHLAREHKKQGTEPGFQWLSWHSDNSLRTQYMCRPEPVQPIISLSKRHVFVDERCIWLRLKARRATGGETVAFSGYFATSKRDS